MLRFQALKWDLTPMSPNMWMCVYLQALNHDDSLMEVPTLTKPLFSGHSFVQIARVCLYPVDLVLTLCPPCLPESDFLLQLLDLCLLDIGSLQFSYGQLAAAVLYHFTDEASMLQASG